MRIFFDIGHPAHVHYFKNLIFYLQRNEDEILLTARDKEVSLQLLEAYNIPYINRGKGGQNSVSKFFYLFKADFQLYWLAKKFKPDAFISFASPYAAHASYVLGIPHIAFDDSDHVKLGQKMYEPFTDYIYTPNSYRKNFGTKHTKFQGYMELSALHPKYFHPDPAIFKKLNLEVNDPFIILRFVSWNADHDKGRTGFSNVEKQKIVSSFREFANVFISSESPLPSDLQRYKIDIKPEDMHSVLYYSKLLYGESATMATESAVLGTPAIFFDRFNCSNTDDFSKKYDLLHVYDFSEGNVSKSIKDGIKFIKNEKDYWQSIREKIIDENINLTDYMIEVVNKFRPG